MALSVLPPDDTQSGTDNEKILISFSNQKNVKNLIYLALLVSNPKKIHGLVGLHVMYDNCSEADREQGKKLLLQAQEVAAKADVTLQTQNRLATELIKRNTSCFERKRCLRDYRRTTHTSHARRIVLRPRTAQSTEQNGSPNHDSPCRHADKTECTTFMSLSRKMQNMKLDFTGGQNASPEWGDEYRPADFLSRPRQNPVSQIQAYLQRYHTSVLYEMQETDGGNELKRLSTELQLDDLMVIIMARHGSVSFRPSLEHVPHQINAYYTDKNFILLFPDSYAPASPELTFVELHGTRGTYEKKKGWLDFLWKKEEQN